MIGEIRLKPVSKPDHEFLFELLKERDSLANISHKKMPSYSEHIKFVKSKPYSHWYIIVFREIKVGTIYLTKQNEIGIFLKKNFHGHSIGKKALKMIMDKHPRKRFLANVNPKNRKSIRFFKNNGFSLIQYTFELDKK